jgi:hypothetical protein
MYKKLTLEVFLEINFSLPLLQYQLYTAFFFLSIEVKFIFTPYPSVQNFHYPVYLQ